MTANTVAHVDYTPDEVEVPAKPGFLKRMFTRENVIKFSKKAALTGGASFAARTGTVALAVGTGIGAVGTGPVIIAAAVVGGMASGAANIWWSQRAAKLHNAAYPHDQKPVPSLFSKQGLKTLAISSALGGLGGAYGPDVFNWAVEKAGAAYTAVSAIDFGTKMADASNAVIKAASNIFGFFKNAGVEEAIAKATPVALENIKPVAANVAAPAAVPASVTNITVNLPEVPALASELVASPEAIIQKAVYVPALPELDVSDLVKGITPEPTVAPASAPATTPLAELIHKPILESVTKPLTEEGHSRWFGFEKPWGEDVGKIKYAAVAPAAPLPPVDALKEYIHKPILESITKPLTEEGHSRWFGLKRPWADAVMTSASGTGIVANAMTDADMTAMINQHIDLTKVSKKTAGIVKEALAGDSQSIKDLAVFMLNGNRRGISVNEDQAVALFKKAASLGNAQAKFDLAKMENLGLHGVAENKESAAQTLKELAAAKFRPAMEALGVAPTGRSAAVAARRAGASAVNGSGVTQKFQKATAAVIKEAGCVGDFKTGETVCKGGFWDKVPAGRIVIPMVEAEKPNALASLFSPLKNMLAHNPILQVK